MSCPSATLENSVWSRDGERWDGEALYVLEDDTMQCGWCLEDVDFDREPAWRQVHAKLRPGSPGRCETCCKTFNNEEDA